MHLDLGTPEAQRVQDAVHRVLVAHDMSASDDMVMAEYVTVMIANQKGLDAIAEELGELVGGDLDAQVPRAIWDAAHAASDAPEAQETREDRRRSASPAPMQQDRATRRERDERPRSERPRSERVQNERVRNERVRNERPREERREPRMGARRRDQELFPVKARTKMQSDRVQEPVSIFGRAGVPDPHAPPFVPDLPPPPPEVAAMMAAMAAGPSLFSRLDPMMPNNPPADVQQASNAAYLQSRDPSTFPTAPSEAALCRYSVHCTNPQCVYSHPSPANAGKNRDENALVLREEACPAGARCTDKECIQSHVSPAVALLPQRPAAALAPPAVPCRFQEQCLNPACTYAHYDASGRPVLPPAARAVPCRFGTRCTRPDCHFAHPTKSKTPCRYGDACTRPDCLFTHPREKPAVSTADRLAPFAEEGGAMERILPGQAEEAVHGSA